MRKAFLLFAALFVLILPAVGSLQTRTSYSASSAYIAMADDSHTSGSNDCGTCVGVTATNYSRATGNRNSQRAATPSVVGSPISLPSSFIASFFFWLRMI